MPKLTVMMAAYHAADTLGVAARSTLRSMPRDAELLIAVDGPDEPTLRAASEVKDPRVRILNDDMNIGTALRHQQMLAESDSEWVANVDADDVSFPWRFRTTLPLLRHVDMAFGGAVWFGQGRVSPSYPITLTPPDVAAVLPFSDPLLHSAMCARRSSLIEIGSYRSIGFSEDWELWMRAAARGARIQKTLIPVVGYRLSPAQMTQNRATYTSSADLQAWRDSRSELLALYGVPEEQTQRDVVRLSQQELERIVSSVRPAARRYVRTRIVSAASVAE